MRSFFLCSPVRSSIESVSNIFSETAMSPPPPSFSSFSSICIIHLKWDLMFTLPFNKDECSRRNCEVNEKIRQNCLRQCQDKLTRFTFLIYELWIIRIYTCLFHKIMFCTNLWSKWKDKKTKIFNKPKSDLSSWIFYFLIK